jgi:acyl dehydratase
LDGLPLSAEPVAPPGSVTDLGAFCFSADEIVAFARQWDPLPIHTDPRAAAAGPFGGLVASGLQTFMTVGREVTRRFIAVQPVIAGMGFDRLRLPAPVRPDEPFRAVLQVVSIEPRGPGRATLSAQITATGVPGVVLDLRLRCVVSAPAR